MCPSPSPSPPPYILNIPAKNSQCYHKCISIHILVRLKFRLPLEPSLFWEKSSPAAGLFLRLVYLCFYLCFWFYVYLVFYPCLTLVFSFILLLCLPWFCFLPSIVSYQGTETFACCRNQLLLAAARRLCFVSYQALLLTKQPRRSLAAGTSSCSRSGRSRTSSCSRPSLLLTGLDASRLGK